MLREARSRARLTPAALTAALLIRYPYEPPEPLSFIEPIKLVKHAAHVGERGLAQVVETGALVNARIKNQAVQVDAVELEGHFFDGFDIGDVDAS
jgi:hypothetical protein